MINQNINKTKNMDIIQTISKQIPKCPGVYQMLDAAGKVLYVGKAYNLQKRIKNYAQRKNHTNRIMHMISKIKNIQVTITRTESEALLLEASMIKRLKPRFNILLRDDKSFPYILITDKQKIPALYKHRFPPIIKGSYFGPFASVDAVEKTIDSLQRAFFLRSCPDSIFGCRSRPCLLFQIKRCSGPCTGEISAEKYMEFVNETKEFLSGRNHDLKEKISSQMNQATIHEDYESAIIYRDRLVALSHIQNHSDFDYKTMDFFSIYHDKNIACIQTFFFRFGQNRGTCTFFLKTDPQSTNANILSHFLRQFYEDKPCPENILLSEEVEESQLLEMSFFKKYGHKVKITVPKRGEKRKIIEQAFINARKSHSQKLSSEISHITIMKDFAQKFALPHIPKRIEIYDNSHIMGHSAVGCMVVVGENGFIKNQYRKFNFSPDDIKTQDDCAMMHMVLEKRFSLLIKNEKSLSFCSKKNEYSFPSWPDVVILDGGKGQFSAAQNVFKKLNIENRVTVISIAKGEERNAGMEKFFIENGKELMLHTRDPVLYFVQRLRDEAHRFAITTHRRRRKKAAYNPLDVINGIGPLRKRVLLQSFGTVKMISRSSPETLASIKGISKKIACKIYSHFHKNTPYKSK
ncbi:excinuclease ABC subunit UvrC [Candidatus Liberibacter africanus]|uniref:UvrABC system protein C n=1 Tax=Candidatus Liberibacter africanus PTSAPSY TaxID=1277257 RepID=A0A0G3I6Z8_LIBAF|nr:excinuclease ABC subunit UvrC [Candidatus Liberibacter africanus]AKK20308.1 excinuclease ABC subunit C [Candidatus Liberibacter africanus PTSAPSY]QTP64062.1 excinuclease ABC subunit UvrC [Candidatus Liberibacter africanus]